MIELTVGRAVLSILSGFPGVGRAVIAPQLLGRFFDTGAESSRYLRQRTQSDGQAGGLFERAALTVSCAETSKSLLLLGLHRRFGTLGDLS